MRFPLSRIPLQSSPYRVEDDGLSEAVPAAPGGVLLGFRQAALVALAVVITVASAASFAESYRGLWLWARHHGLSGFWAGGFPLQVDAFIVAGELTLFIAMVDGWTRRGRAGAWMVALLGLAVSVAGNIGHVAATDIQSRGTAAIPPFSAFCALWVALTVLKRITGGRDAKRAAAPEVPGAALPEIPTDSESAAVLALRVSTYAGNPMSGRQLEAQFGLTRAQVTRVRQAVHGSANGSLAPGDAGNAGS